jgi:hypothetical protein
MISWASFGPTQWNRFWSFVVFHHFHIWSFRLFLFPSGHQWPKFIMNVQNFPSKLNSQLHKTFIHQSCPFLKKFSNSYWAHKDLKKLFFSQKNTCPSWATLLTRLAKCARSSWLKSCRTCGLVVKTLVGHSILLWVDIETNWTGTSNFIRTGP